MIKCAIIGGGLAGLTSAVYLSKAGFQVKLYEASPKCGGRAYSFTDETSGDIVDNGQHIMMGCYFNTLEFLKITKSINKIYFQNKLDINFVDKSVGLAPLIAFSTIYPFNLLIGLLNYKAITLYERVKIVKTISKLLFLSSKNVGNYSVRQWLVKEKQSTETIKAFWEILVVGALNSNIDDASAEMFVDILKKIFFSGNKAASILIPKDGLSQVLINDAVGFIEENDGKVYTSYPVESIIIEDKKAVGLKFKNKIEKDFDFIISTVPHYALEKLIDVELLGIPKIDFEYSPILTAHIWLKDNIFDKIFYGLINSPVHWIFNKGKYITIVISNAESFLEKRKENIMEIITDEIMKYFPKFKSDFIQRYLIIKEKRATFISSKSILNKRPGVHTRIENLYIGGDWINTGLPATIEGAIKSGKLVCRELMRDMRK